MKIMIIGAGMAGLTLAIRLKQFGIDPVVFEEHEENELVNAHDVKSVNITISYRGIQALEQIDCADALRGKSMDVTGRTHFINGTSHFTPYTLKTNSCLYSIERKDLAKILIQRAQKDGVKIQFGRKLIESRFYNKICLFLHENKVQENPYDFLFATDGMHSKIREWLRIPYTVTQRDYIYKKIDIDSDNARKLGLNNHAVNIWSNSKGLFFTLPNQDGSQSGLLNITSRTLDEIESDSASLRANFPDLIHAVDNFSEKFQTTPPGSFKEIRCDRWFARSSVLLMGDAVHAMMPFYAQGANCALEDVSIFCKMLEGNNRHVQNASLEFQATRPPVTQAIVTLSRGNLKNLKVKKKFDEYLSIKNLELSLEQKFPDYFSEYSMVAFTNVPYDEILRLSRKRGPILAEFSKKAVHEISDKVLNEIHSKL